MRIRHKIALWITGTGIVAAVALSLIVFAEVSEVQYKSLDAELKVIARILGRLALDGTPVARGTPMGDLLGDLDRYWARIYDGHMNLLYQTTAARNADLPLRGGRGGYTVTVRAHEDRSNASSEGSEVTFRVETVHAEIHGLPCVIQVAKPIGRIRGEVLELVRGFAIGLLLTSLLLIFLSFVVAGWILKPVRVIDRLARDISDKSLDQRIPLGRSRDELYRLSRSLNRMFDRLQYSFAVQKQFIADAAHELKSPLTLLRLFMEDAVQRTDLPETFRKGLIRQNDILRRMSRLVKNLLDLSALELRETIDFREVDLAGLLKAVLEDYEELFAAKHIRIAMDCPETLRVVGDRDKLQRGLINLVDNAVRYNDDRGEIAIAARRGNRTVSLSLSNTGPGIPEADLDKVFDPFYRVEKSRSPQYGGAGLGLAIVKRIVELHRGSIWIENAPEGRVRVTIRLPKQAADGTGTTLTSPSDFRGRFL